MHAVTHSLAQRAPPATRTRARWQPYNALQSLSARSSPAVYLHTPASSVTSASPTPPQTLSSICDNNRPRHAVSPREPSQAQKTKYVVGLVDQAVKSLCDIWHPQDIPSAFITGSRATSSDAPATDPTAPFIATVRPIFHSRNTQLPSPITPSTQPSPISPAFPSSDTYVSHTPTQLVPLKGFVHEVLRRSRTSGSVLQTALCYLEAIRSKVPELVEKEKNGSGVQGEVDLSGRIVPGDLEAEEWRELSLDSVMADFIHLDAAVDVEAAESDFLPTVKFVDSDEAPLELSFTGGLTSDPTLTGLKSHLVQNLTKKPKTPSGPLVPMVPLPSPLLCPRRTFLASLILASKFMQDRCYSNKAWAKLSGLPPREIGRCERALGDALDWRLWVGKAPPAPQSSRAVVRSKSDGELFTTRSESESRVGLSVVTSSNGSSAALRRSSTLPALGFGQDFMHAHVVPEVSWELLAWPSHNFAAPSSSSSSPSTPSLSHSPSSTDSSSGDRTIQMTSFLDVTPSPGQFVPLSMDKGGSMYLGAPYAYAAHHHAGFDVDPTSGLSFPTYHTHGVDAALPYTHASTGVAHMYSTWTS